MHSTVLSSKYNFDYWKDYVGGISNISRSVLCDISVRVIMYVFRLNVGARHFPSHCTTIFVIVVENILRGEGVIYVTM